MLNIDFEPMLLCVTIKDKKRDELRSSSLFVLISGLLFFDALIDGFELIHHIEACVNLFECF